MPILKFKALPIVGTIIIPILKTERGKNFAAGH